MDGVAELLDQAIAHLSRPKPDASVATGGDAQDGAAKRAPRQSPGAAAASVGTVSVGTLERLRDLRVSLEGIKAMLRTGLKGEGLYSTSPEDYMDPNTDTPDTSLEDDAELSLLDGNDGS